MRAVIFRVLMVFAMLIAAPVLASGQETVPETGSPVKIEKRQLLVPRKGESVAQTPFKEDPMQWLRETQRNIYGSMATTLRSLRGAGGAAAGWSLVLLSFGYGVFHAAGPGHGKTVISAWLLATEQQLKRGILVAFLSSLVQALSAIAIVSVLLFVVGGAITKARAAAQALESMSYGMIGLLGLYLIWSTFRPHHGHTHGHHGHDHQHHHHDHEHDHHVHGGHDHTHAPAAKDMDQNWSLARACSMAFAIGIRPCTGAILVLFAAYPLGLFEAGLLSVFAMAAGTFITVAVIATIAVYGRSLAQSLASYQAGRLSWVLPLIRFTAGALIAVLGAALFWSSLTGGLPTGL